MDLLFKNLISKQFGTLCYVAGVSGDLWGNGKIAYQIVACKGQKTDYHPGWMSEEDIYDYYRFPNKVEQVLYGK